MKRWPTKPLAEAYWFQEGPGVRKWQFRNSGIKLLNVANITKEGVLDLSKTDRHLSEEEVAEKYSHFLADEGDLVIASSGISFDEDGLLRTRGAFVKPQHLPLCVNTSTVRFKPKEGVSTLPWLRYWLDSAEFREQITRLVTGSAQQNFGPSHLKATKISLPPLAEQERIVKLLDEADELRKLRTQADRRAANLIPALFHEMFAKAKFTEKTIGEYLKDGWLRLHKDGNHGSLYPRVGDFGNEGIPFLTATCVTEKGAIEHSEVKLLSENKSKQLRHGWLERDDVLLAHNATVGKVGYYEGDYDRALIGTSLTTFRVNPERIDSRFLWAALRDEFFQYQLERIMKQALRNQVPITAQRELLLRVPHLTLQKEFAQRVNEIRELEAAQAASHQRVDHLFQSMLHRAFNQAL